HGEIKNLEMPPMTMVFRVADASVVGDLNQGDKVRFRAEQVNGAYHVKQIEKAP
ncbi:MAG: copper-binding protein, partial [Gammaproteobacteria bacterium]|nr:copper-binding protein [Gammaproteobacteria bacterium]